VVIPARNEAEALPQLLRSLRQMDHPALEIIVVDDHSVDGTGEIARNAGATVVTAPPLPAGWSGKSWACHHGAKAASHAFILFTDADTVHGPQLLKRAMSCLHEDGVELVSALPFHLTRTFWERIQGSFQLMVLTATWAAHATSNQRHCIGQFLLFRRQMYEAVGGHHHVHAALAEDIALCAAIRDAGGGVRLLTEADGLQVRMYTRPGDFLQGWRRNFNHGFRTAMPAEVGRVVAAVGWLLGAPLWLLFSGGGPETLLAAGNLMLAVGVVALAQHGRGQFPLWSAPFYPVFLLLHSGVSAAAALDVLFRRPVAWRGRIYAAGEQP